MQHPDHDDAPSHMLVVGNIVRSLVWQRELDFEVIAIQPETRKIQVKSKMGGGWFSAPEMWRIYDAASGNTMKFILPEPEGMPQCGEPVRDRTNGRIIEGGLCVLLPGHGGGCAPVPPLNAAMTPKRTMVVVGPEMGRMGWVCDVVHANTRTTDEPASTRPTEFKVQLDGDQAGAWYPIGAIEFEGEGDHGCTRCAADTTELYGGLCATCDVEVEYEEDEEDGEPVVLVAARKTGYVVRIEIDGGGYKGKDVGEMTQTEVVRWVEDMEPERQKVWLVSLIEWIRVNVREMKS